MKVSEKMFNSKTLSRFVLGAYMVLIFYVSSLPNLTLASIGMTVNNFLAHMVEYAILGVLMGRVVAQFTSNVYAVFFSSFALSLGYGISDEAHQFFVPTRFCTVTDVCVDAIGSLVGVLLYLAITEKRSHKSHH